MTMKRMEHCVLFMIQMTGSSFVLVEYHLRMEDSVTHLKLFDFYTPPQEVARYYVISSDKLRVRLSVRPQAVS